VSSEKGIFLARFCRAEEGGTGPIHPYSYRSLSSDPRERERERERDPLIIAEKKKKKKKEAVQTEAADATTFWKKCHLAKSSAFELWPCPSADKENIVRVHVFC
jgi:hypothetical protein